MDSVILAYVMLLCTIYECFTTLMFLRDYIPVHYFLGDINNVEHVLTAATTIGTSYR